MRSSEVAALAWWVGRLKVFDPANHALLKQELYKFLGDLGVFKNRITKLDWLGVVEQAEREASKEQPPSKPCDNPSCWNPDHLFTGTLLENAQDRNSKGRQAKGERNGASKLTEAQVRAIRRMYATGNYTQQELGAIFALTQQPVSAIVLRRTWKHLSE